MKQVMVAHAPVDQEYHATVVDVRTGACYLIRTVQSSIVDAALDIARRIAMPDRRNIGMNPHTDFHIVTLTVVSCAELRALRSPIADFELAFPRS